MVDFKKLSEKEEKKEELQSLTVPFMGGKAVITPAATYDINGKIINVAAKVKMGKMFDEKGNCDPQSFLSMIRIIVNNPEAIALLEKL